MEWKTIEVGSAESTCIEMVELGICDGLLNLRHKFVVEVILKLRRNE